MPSAARGIVQTNGTVIVLRPLRTGKNAKPKRPTRLRKRNCAPAGQPVLSSQQDVVSVPLTLRSSRSFSPAWQPSSPHGAKSWTASILNAGDRPFMRRSNRSESPSSPNALSRIDIRRSVMLRWLAVLKSQAR